MTMFSDSMMMMGGDKAPAFGNLAALFNAGAVDGVMIDLTDKTTLFQDANGALPVVNNGDPVGLALDQHKWGGLTLAAHRAAQAELQTNGDFGSGISGWTQDGSFAALTWDAANQRLVVTANGANIPSVGGPTITGLTVGRWYEVSVNIVTATGSGNFNIYVGSSVGSGSMLNFGIVATTGAYRRLFKANATSAVVTVGCRAGSGVITTIDNVSVKEIDGHHATATSTNRPLWQSATSDVLFDGSNDYLSVDGFDFPAGDCALAVWAKSNTAAKTIAGVVSGAVNMALIHKTTGNFAFAKVGNNLGISGSTTINGTYRTIAVDKNSASANLVVDGVTEATKVTPGTTAIAIDFAIGGQNNDGTPGAFMAGNIKRVIALQARIQDTMTADFHQNLIAP